MEDPYNELGRRILNLQDEIVELTSAVLELIEVLRNE
jgi:hypothetical protein